MEALERPEESVSRDTLKLARTVNWGTVTVIGVFAGMLYGGSREAAASASKDAEVMLKLGSTPDKREQHRIMRDAMEKMYIRVSRGSIVGGLRLGMFTAAFYGLQSLLTEKRGVHDVFNVVGAGSATAATSGPVSKKYYLFHPINYFCCSMHWFSKSRINEANIWFLNIALNSGLIA